MPPNTPTSGLDALDAKAEQSRRRHRTPPPPKRKVAERAPAEPVGESAPTAIPEQAPSPLPEVEAAPRAALAAAEEREERAPTPVAARPPATRPSKRTTAPAAPIDPAAVNTAVKIAHDHALAYGAAIRKQTERMELWLGGIRAAREVGASPGLLRAGLEDAANRAGIPVDDIPAPVWRAAGLTPPG